MKPRFFGIVGWSWFGFSALGVVLGILSLPSLFQVDELRSLFAQYGSNQLPPELNPFNKILDWLIPGTLIQLGSSIIMTWVSWEFLKRKNWARLSLSGINASLICGTLWGIFKLTRFFQGFYEKYGLQEMIEAGFVSDFPRLINIGLSISAFILLLPLVWMAWYFHRPKVKAYFESV